MKWKQHFYTKTSSGYLLLNMVVWWGCISGRERSRGGEGALMSNLVSHRWYDAERLTVPGSSNLNLSFSRTQKKSFVKKMKENCVTFCFIKLNANRFLQNHRGKSDVSVQKSGSLLSKLIFTHVVSYWSRSHEIVEK